MMVGSRQDLLPEHCSVSSVFSVSRLTSRQLYSSVFEFGYSVWGGVDQGGGIGGLEDDGKTLKSERGMLHKLRINLFYDLNPLDMEMFDSKQDNCPELVDSLARCKKDLVVSQRNMEKMAQNVLSSNTTTVKLVVESKPVRVRTASEILLKRHLGQIISRLGLRSLESFVSPLSTLYEEPHTGFL